MRAGHVRSEAGARLQWTPQRERLGFALHVDRLQPFVVEHALGLPVGLLGDGDPAHRGDSLEPRGGVDHVAGNDPLALLRAAAERHHRLARVDPDPDLQRQARVVLVQFRDRLQDAQRGPDRTLGVVLVRKRSSEHGHDRVADELLHRAAVALDLLSQALVVRTDAGAHVLGVGGLGGGGEADQVAEEDGDDLALLGRQGGFLRQRSGAERTERKLARELLAAGRAGRHRPSLGQPLRTGERMVPRLGLFTPLEGAGVL